MPHHSSISLESDAGISAAVLALQVAAEHKNLVGMQIVDLLWRHALHFRARFFLGLSLNVRIFLIFHNLYSFFDHILHFLVEIQRLQRESEQSFLFVNQWDKDGIDDDGGEKDRKGVGGGYEVGLNHGDTFLVEQSPVDTDENAAVAHGIMRRDERVIVARKQKHVTVSQIDMRFFHFDGQSQVDEGEVADLHLVLQMKNAGGGHVGIGIILGEIAHRDGRMQYGGFVENRLRIPDFQPALKQRQMHNFFIA